VGARHETPALEQPQFKRSRTQSPLPSCAGVELAEEDKELDDELAFDGDHTRHMAHSVFMHISVSCPRASCRRWASSRATGAACSCLIFAR